MRAPPALLLSLALLLACGEKTADDTATSEVDADGDGFSADEDCDDSSFDIFPGNDEFCDGIDNNCDGIIDSADAVDAPTWYIDADGDGYGVAAQTRAACTAPDGYAATDDDCDDTDARFNPAAVEDDCADPSDYNCDGSVGYADADGDGWAACEECDDARSDVSPDSDELCDGIDNNCDGDTDGEDAVDAPLWFVDADHDGYGSADSGTPSCVLPPDHAANGDDCDDTSADISPSAAEVCDSIDNNCDGEVDEAGGAVLYHRDADGDGYGDSSLTSDACAQPSGYVEDGEDCDDSDASIHPDAEEVWFDGIDADCDSFDGYTLADLAEGDLIITEIMANPDAASDTYGEWVEVYNTTDAAVNLYGLTFADSASSDDVDSDLIIEAGGVVVLGIDGDTTRNGGVTVDFDWSGPSLNNSGETLSLSYGKLTFDAVNFTGWTVSAGKSLSLSRYAHDATSNDTSSNWCVSAVTYGDGDYGSPGDINTESCGLFSPDDADHDGYDADEECDDTDATAYPGAAEVCDDTDNDCDGDVDEDAVDAPVWYVDLDGDGYGDPDDTLAACEQPSGYVEDSEDCDDTDDSIYPTAEEIDDDGVDQDCDGEDNVPATVLTVAELGAGDLVINEIMANPSAVSDSYGEWFEIYNASGEIVNLKGLVFADNASSDTVDIEILVSAGGYAVLGIDGDTTRNGGVTVDFDWSGPALGNSGDSLTLSYGSVTIDKVDFSSWTIPTGKSLSLSVLLTDATSNDTSTNWCSATGTYGSGDYGSPGSANSGC